MKKIIASLFLMFATLIGLSYPSMLFDTNNGAVIAPKSPIFTNGPLTASFSNTMVGSNIQATVFTLGGVSITAWPTGSGSGGGPSTNLYPSAPTAGFPIYFTLFNGSNVANVNSAYILANSTTGTSSGTTNIYNPATSSFEPAGGFAQSTNGTFTGILTFPGQWHSATDAPSGTWHYTNIYGAGFFITSNSAGFTFSLTNANSWGSIAASNIIAIGNAKVSGNGNFGGNVTSGGTVQGAVNTLDDGNGNATIGNINDQGTLSVGGNSTLGAVTASSFTGPGAGLTQIPFSSLPLPPMTNFQSGATQTNLTSRGQFGFDALTNSGTGLSIYSLGGAWFFGPSVILSAGGFSGSAQFLTNMGGTTMSGGAQPIFTATAAGILTNAVTAIANSVLGQGALLNAFNVWTNLNQAGQSIVTLNTNGISLRASGIGGSSPVNVNVDYSWNTNSLWYTNINGAGVVYSSSLGSYLAYTNGVYTGFFSSILGAASWTANSAITTLTPPVSDWAKTLNGSSIIPVNLNANNLGGVPATNVWSQQPVALNVANYGAVPNGYIFTNISVTNITLTCPTANFLMSAAVGDAIAINFVGANDRYFITYVSNVFNNTTIGLSNAVVNPITNWSYCAICTIPSSSNNLAAFQTTLNQLTNFQSATVNIPPPIWYSEMEGIPLSQMGQCYMFVTNSWGVGGFQNPSANHSMLIVPPLMANNPANLGNRAEVTIQGYVPWHWWGNGTGPSYIGISPNVTALLVAALDDGRQPTNWLGPSFLDTRCFTNWQYETPDPSGNTYVPGNDTAVYLKDFTIFSSYDGGIVLANLLGSADGSGLINMNLLGGDQANNFNVGGRLLCYPYMRGNYPKDTNSIAVIMPGSNFGNYGTAHNTSITGQYIGFEAGQLQGENDLIDFCSNGVDMSYGGSINVDLRDLSFGGCFNGFTLIRSAAHSPAEVYSTVMTCGGNSIPTGNSFNVLYDQGYINTASDYFSPSAGHITLLGPVNAGAPINTTPGTTFAGGGIVIDAFYPEQPATWSMLNGQLAFGAGSELISTNNALFIGENGTSLTVNNRIASSGFSGTAMQLDSAGIGMSFFFRNDAISTPNLFYFANIGNLSGSSFYGQIGSDQIIPQQSMILENDIGKTLNWFSTTNSWTAMKGVVYYDNTNTLQNLNGTFSLAAVTNGMYGTNFWEGESNMSLVIVKYAGGVVTYQTVMQ